MSIQFKTTGHLFSLLNEHPKPILLLGAGASIQSGIPSTKGLVERIAKWGYAKEIGIAPEDARIMRSDWQPWLNAKPWYNGALTEEENYPDVIDNILNPRQERYDFFTKILKPGIPPSDGYSKLSDLIARKAFDTILTTNFDSILKHVCDANQQVHILNVYKTQEEYDAISTSPAYPQLIHLHGAIETYTDKNLRDETKTLLPLLVTRLTPLLRDHPIIVIGYRGSEDSIMRNLLIENAKQTANFRHGIYWCTLESEKNHLTPQVQELAATIGNNFQLVEIDSFDELIVNELWKRFEYSPYKQTTSQLPAANQQFSINDLRVIEKSTLQELDMILLRVRLQEYCKALNIKRPVEYNDDWLSSMLIERDLAIKEQGILTPRFSGYLLFGKQPSSRIDNCKVEVVINGEKEWIERKIHGNSLPDPFEKESENKRHYFIEGNLWDQLEEATKIISLFNRPFRLKTDMASENVFPYPPLALRELLVNALVHRDYTLKGNITIEITHSFIRILNPGGLVGEVINQISLATIEEEIKSGTKGIKGYRNPVLADLFYSSGAMDKVGSGLSDVVKEVQINSANVEFGPNSENSSFEAIIYSREELIDEVTNTAISKGKNITRFSSNILEFAKLPQFVYAATCSYTRYFEAYDAIGKTWIPPFVLSGGSIFSFIDFRETNNPLKGIVDIGTIDAIAVDEFNIDTDRQRLFVSLLNKSLSYHFRNSNLFVDEKRKRAYFPNNNGDERQITYQARIKSAKRTVAKKRVSSITNKVRYWEHKSFWYYPEQFGEQWGLIVVPGYVFTENGERLLLESKRIGILSTKRASRDYNNHCLNDLSFWSWVISNGKSNEIELKLTRENVNFQVPYEAQIIIKSKYTESAFTNANFQEVEIEHSQDEIEKLYKEIEIEVEQELYERKKNKKGKEKR